MLLQKYQHHAQFYYIPNQPQGFLEETQNYVLKIQTMNPDNESAWPTRWLKSDIFILMNLIDVWIIRRDITNPFEKKLRL